MPPPPPNAGLSQKGCPRANPCEAPEAGDPATAGPAPKTLNAVGGPQLAGCREGPSLSPRATTAAGTRAVATSHPGRLSGFGCAKPHGHGARMDPLAPPRPPVGRLLLKPPSSRPPQPTGPGRERSPGACRGAAQAASAIEERDWANALKLRNRAVGAEQIAGGLGATAQRRQLPLTDWPVTGRRRSIALPLNMVWPGLEGGLKEPGLPATAVRTNRR